MPEPDRQPTPSLFADTPVLIRGGGDLATGVAIRLHRAGFPVVITELAGPLTVRRTVAMSSAVSARTAVVEGVTARLVTIDGVERTLADREIPVLVSAQFPNLRNEPQVVIDARLAKRNIDTAITDAPLVVALGPGFIAGQDCHAVVETARGHTLGRVIWSGGAIPNTGTPGLIAGKGRERVLRAPAEGPVSWTLDIGAVVEESQLMGTVGSAEVRAPFEGLVRGLIANGTLASAGLKIGDVDPRIEPDSCHQVSDKALAIGGGVIESVLTWLNKSA